MRIFAFIFFLVGSTFSLAQTGSLHVIVSTLDYQDSIVQEVGLFIEENNELVYKQRLTDETINVEINDLAIGTYNLKLYRSGVLIQTTHALKVVKDSICEITLNPVDLRYYNPNKNKHGRLLINGGENPANFAFCAQFFQPLTSDANKNITSINSFGFKVSPLLNVAKFYNVGITMGLNMGFCRLQRNKINAFADTFIIERYSYLKMPIGLTNRFIFKQPKETKIFTPIFLDLNVSYNLPFMYRYVGVDVHTKSIKRYITNFNDFSVSTRLGFGVLAFTAEYKFTNYIKSPYLDVPKLILGIDLIFPSN